jgi:hypothetical protein
MEVVFERPEYSDRARDISGPRALKHVRLSKFLQKSTAIGLGGFMPKDEKASLFSAIRKVNVTNGKKGEAIVPSEFEQYIVHLEQYASGTLDRSPR